ncbi:hypothetical protein HOY82DRAFT_557446, partial [Tuber indicum]
MKTRSNATTITPYTHVDQYKKLNHDAERCYGTCMVPRARDSRMGAIATLKRWKFARNQVGMYSIAGLPDVVCAYRCRVW